jgi:hypothetical protein
MRSYSPNPVHRNFSKGKSQWTITAAQERKCFDAADDAGWLLENKGWGLFRVRGQLTYLGLAQDHKQRVFIAKFVDSSVSGIWHGYPADHQRHAADRPDMAISAEWLKENIVPPAKLRKILKGERCNL